MDVEEKLKELRVKVPKLQVLVRSTSHGETSPRIKSEPGWFVHLYCYIANTKAIDKCQDWYGNAPTLDAAWEEAAKGIES